MNVVVVIFTIFASGYSLPIGGVSYTGSLSSTAILTPLENLGDKVDGAVSTFAKSKCGGIPNKTFSILTPFPDSGRARAVLEQKSLESLPIKLDDKYGNLQQFVANIVNPLPIVDTIQEHEKYGNDGEHFRKVANVVIGGIEGVSNKLNTIAELPFTALSHGSKSVSASLNTVGGKLVGLS